jgi:hypothetical protein
MVLFRFSGRGDFPFALGLRAQKIDVGCGAQMPFSEQHLALAKLVRNKGVDAPRSEQEQWIRKSNSFLVCAWMAARDRGDISLEGFAWKALTPDWSFIDEQMSRLPLPRIDGPSIVPDL